MIRLTNDKFKEAELLLRIYEIYSSDPMHDAFVWFSKNFNAKSFEDYEKSYPLGSEGRKYFNRIGNFFDVLGMLVEKNLVSKDLIIEFCPDDVKSFWNKTMRLILEMRTRWDDPTLFSGVEALNKEIVKWQKTLKKHHAET